MVQDGFLKNMNILVGNGQIFIGGFFTKPYLNFVDGCIMTHGDRFATGQVVTEEHTR